MTGFVVPPYPHDRLSSLRRLAESHPLGLLDLSIGTPNDSLPLGVQTALAESIATTSHGYPTSVGSFSLRDSVRSYLQRRHDVVVPEAAVMACVGTKELVASLPRMLQLRNPERTTVLYPAIAYPTYAMGAELAGLRAVPVEMDANWSLNLESVSAADRSDALLLWTNDPSNPTGAAANEVQLDAIAAWAREHEIVIASDECYSEFANLDRSSSGGSEEEPPAATMLRAGTDGILAVHSLSKRSNAAGLRSGFVAGDPAIVDYLLNIRKHAGLMMPGPIQAASAAAWADDEHVMLQRDRYRQRRAVALEQLAGLGFVHDGGPHTFYLWLRSNDVGEDGWEIAAKFAKAGILVAPGDLYGPLGADHVRIALVADVTALSRIVERFS